MSVRDLVDERSSRLTSVLVGNDLGLVVDEVRDGAVGVAESDADRRALAWLRARLSSAVTHGCWDTDISGDSALDGMRDLYLCRVDGQFAV